jgi:hypothetical protein
LPLDWRLLAILASLCVISDLMEERAPKRFVRRLRAMKPAADVRDFA